MIEATIRTGSVGGATNVDIDITISRETHRVCDVKKLDVFHDVLTRAVYSKYLGVPLRDDTVGRITADINRVVTTIFILHQLGAIA